MKKYLLILLFLVVSCSSTAEDTKAVFLNKINGAWKITKEGSDQLSKLSSPITVAEGTVINVVNGSFTINGIAFTFLYVGNTGVLAVYEFTVTTANLYLGLGFNRDNNVISVPVQNSPDSFATAVSTSGILFMVR